MYAINLEHEETSPESGDILAVSDVVSNLFGSPVIATVTVVTV